MSFRENKLHVHVSAINFLLVDSNVNHIDLQNWIRECMIFDKSFQFELKNKNGKRASYRELIQKNINFKCWKTSTHFVSNIQILNWQFHFSSVHIWYFANIFKKYFFFCFATPFLRAIRICQNNNQKLFAGFLNGNGMVKVSNDRKLFELW